MRIQKSYLLFCAVFFLSFHIAENRGVALESNQVQEETKHFDPEKTDNSQFINFLNLFESSRKGLMDERLILEKQAEETYEHFKDLATLIVVIIAALGGILAWLIKVQIGSNKKELKEFVMKSLSLDFSEIRGALLGQIQQEAKLDLEKLRLDLVKEMENAHQITEEIKKRLDDLTSYKKRPIVWICSNDSSAKNRNEEIQMLLSLGLDVSVSLPKSGEEVQISHAALIIISFEKDGVVSDSERQIVEKVIQESKTNKVPIPILIYSRSELSGPIDLIIKSYGWALYVQFPISLISYTLNLVRNSIPLIEVQGV